MKKRLKPKDRAFVIQGLADHRRCTACIGEIPGVIDREPLGYLVGANGKRYQCPECHGTKTEDHGVRFAVREVEIYSRRVHTFTGYKGRTTTEVQYGCTLVRSAVAFQMYEDGLFATQTSADRMRQKLQKRKSLQPIKGLGIWRKAS